MSSNISKLKSIIQLFKIKFNDLKHLRLQPEILDQVAGRLNIRLNKKDSFNKKMLAILRAFIKYQKNRQLFDQDKSKVDQAFEAQNKARHRSGEKTGVPEAQKIIIPSGFQQPQQTNQIFSEKQVESLRDLIKDRTREIKDLQKALAPKERLEFEEEVQEEAERLKEKLRNTLSKQEFEKIHKEEDFLPDQYDDLSIDLKAYTEWINRDINDHEFLQTVKTHKSLPVETEDDLSLDLQSEITSPDFDEPSIVTENISNFDQPSLGNQSFFGEDSSISEYPSEAQEIENVDVDYDFNDESVIVKEHKNNINPPLVEKIKRGRGRPRKNP
jgi:hypothetical protein